MGQRLDLHNLFKAIPGVRAVYYQAPASNAMLYPCILYNRDAMDTKFANNLVYLNKNRYLVTVIDPDPDSLIHSAIEKLPLTSFNRHFAINNLYHDVYSIFY